MVAPTLWGIQLVIYFLAVARISSQGFWHQSVTLPFTQSMSGFSYFSQGRPRMKSSFPMSVTQALIFRVSVLICIGTMTSWMIFPDLLGMLSMLYTGMDLASHLDSSLSLMTTLGWMKIPSAPLSINILMSTSFSLAKAGICMGQSDWIANSTGEIVTEMGECCVVMHCPFKNPLHLSETKNAPGVLCVSHKTQKLLEWWSSNHLSSVEEGCGGSVWVSHRIYLVAWCDSYELNGLAYGNRSTGWRPNAPSSLRQTGGNRPPIKSSCRPFEWRRYPWR